MEISGIRTAFPFIFPNGEKEGDASQVNQQEIADKVDVHSPELLADDEVDGVLAETIGMIGQNGSAALAVHSLNAQRVFALLGL